MFKFILASIVLSLFAFCAPTKPANPGPPSAPTRADVIRRIGVVSHDIGNTVDKGRKGVSALLSAKIITPQEANAIRLGLIDASKITKEYSVIIRGNLTDAGIDTALEAWAYKLAEANKRLVDDGTFHVKNPTARSEISTILGVTAVNIVTINQLVEELKQFRNNSEKEGK